LWIHLFDPHYPVQPPKEFIGKILEQTKSKRQSFISFLLDEHHIDSGFYKKGINQMFEVISSYDGEILYADTEIERFFKSVQSKGLNSNTLWIITSDHGEGLGNHRWYFHGKHIYNEQIHIPLIFYFSSGSFAGMEIDNIVENVDILPTVAELVDGELKEQIKPVQGTSLLSLLAKDKGVFSEKYAFAQRRDYDEKHRPKEISPETDYEDGERYTLQDREYKYFYRTQGKDEFYNLSDDPYEVNNILGSGQDVEKKMRDTIINKVKQFEQDVDVKPESVDKGTIERLKSLGYLQ
jgi:arylsulfatase A-like enzyme